MKQRVVKKIWSTLFYNSTNTVVLKSNANTTTMIYPRSTIQCLMN